MIQNALELLTSIYLSFPNHRKNFISFQHRLSKRGWQFFKRHQRIATRKSGEQVNKTGTQKDVANEESTGNEHNPEFLFACVGIISTLVITIIVLAIGYSVNYARREF